MRPDVWNFELLNKEVSEGVRDSEHEVLSKVAMDAIRTEEIPSFLG
jgi:hypothetical protein